MWTMQGDLVGSLAKIGGLALGAPPTIQAWAEVLVRFEFYGGRFGPPVFEKEITDSLA